MGALKALRHEQIEWFADHFAFDITKHLLGTLIEQGDTLVGINGDDRVLGDVQNAFKPGPCGAHSLFGELALNGHRRQMRDLLDDGVLMRSRAGRFAGIDREGAQHLSFRGEDGRGPARSQPMRQGQMAIVGPQWVRGDV